MRRKGGFYDQRDEGRASRVTWTYVCEAERSNAQGSATAIYPEPTGISIKGRDCKVMTAANCLQMTQSRPLAISRFSSARCMHRRPFLPFYSADMLVPSDQRRKCSSFLARADPSIIAIMG
jgi:hypothetical protein